MEKELKPYKGTLAKKSNNRKEKIEIRCTRLEKERIKNNAGTLSISQYLRTVGLKNKIKPQVGPEFFNLTTQLKCIGNNLNQLTKLFHSNLNELVDLNNAEKLLRTHVETKKLLDEVKEIIFDKM